MVELYSKVTSVFNSLFSLTYIASDGDKPDTGALIKGSALVVLDLDGLD